MTLGIIWWGAHLIINGEITVGQLVAFNMLALWSQRPDSETGALWQDFQQG